MTLFVNFIVFQIGWFAAVLGAANQMPWLGPLVIAAAIVLHLTTASRPSAELVLIACCGVIGAVMDSVLVAVGWVSYPAGMLAPNTAPYWIVAMWMLFATTLNVSLGWLKPRKALGFVFGLVGGPLAYYTGFKLGGIQFANFEYAMAALAVGWGAVVPVLLILAERYNGFDTVVPVPTVREA